MSETTEVNPACAGMIRLRPVCAPTLTCKPRVCGDDPARQVVHIGQEQ